MKKRFLSALLAMAMVLTMLPMSAFAVEGETGDSQTPETGDQTPGTGTTTPDDTQEPTTPAVDVVKANLHDTRLDITNTDSSHYGKGIADELLYDEGSYKVTATAGTEANTINVKVEISNLKEHASAPSDDPILAGWVGVGVPYDKDAEYGSGWKPGEDDPELTTSPVDGPSQEVDGKQYVTRYFNASNDTKKDAQILVKKGEVVTTYNIDLRNAKVADPTIKIGFNAAGDKANAEATAWNKEMRSEKALAITDSERNTVYAAIDGLNTRKAYTVELQYSATENGTFAKVDDFFTIAQETAIVNTVVRKTFTPWEGSTGSKIDAENLKTGFYKMVLKLNTDVVDESDVIEIVEVTVDPTSNGVLAVKAGTDEKKPFEAIADGADKGKIKLFAVKGQEKAAFDGIITATANDGWKFDSWTANEANTVFTAKFVAAQISTVSASADNATLTAELKKDGDKNVIAISGLAPVSTTKVTVSYKLDGDNEEAAARTSEITVANTANTTNFTVAADTKITVGGVDYMIDVTGMVASDVTLVVPAPVVDVGEAIEPTDEATVTTAAASTQITEINELIASNAIAVDAAVKAVTPTEKTDAVTELNNLAGVSDATAENVEIVVQPVMNVKATAYDATKKTLTLDVTAGYRLVAVKNDVLPNDVKVSGDTGVEDGQANAVVVKEPVEMTVNTPVEVQVTLPDGFAEDGAIAVLHVKNGDHYHTATVATNVATFTSTDGLSPFTFAAVELVAEVDGKQYTTLQAAVDSIAVNGTATITLLAEPAETTVNKVVTITLNAGDSGYTITENTLKAGDNVNKAFDEETNTFTFTSKGSTGPAPGGVGGSSGSATYSVNVPTAEHGTVTVNPRNAAKDATVTITVAPDKGYHLESLTVTDKDGNKIELTKVDATKYTFKMPASRVEVKAVFAEGEAPAISFTDVAEGEYYYDAVLWAVNKGITNGLTDTTFGPNASCTRAQMVTFLWRAAGSPEPTSTTTAFTDIDSNEYYYKAVLWAVEKGITTGTTETTFSPSATVTRAQTVTFLYRYAGTPAVSGNNNFTDLEAGEYYVDAVQWAATNGITTGTTETTFSPANNCTRGQIVTFLYRHIVK